MRAPGRWTSFSKARVPRYNIGGTPELRFRILVAGDAEARQEYVAGDLYTGPLTVVNVQKLHTL
jgi:hypothetical protein